VSPGARGRLQLAFDARVFDVFGVQLGVVVGAAWATTPSVDVGVLASVAWSGFPISQ
jgi:hypothetical protein